ncbi:hypothetical protein Aab01nite_49770 [Paractinoplanes abujensis]|nr:hypothetical protein Aab01nite_49770 [Actinoplanes abujensis]
MTAAPPLVTCTSAVKPFDHWLAVQATVHAAAADAGGATATAKPAATSAAAPATG